MAARSDSPTGPAPRAALGAKSSFAVGPTNDPTPVATHLKVCKIGDASGTFTVIDVEAGIGGTGNPTIYDGDANTTGTQPVTTLRERCRAQTALSWSRTVNGNVQIPEQVVQGGTVQLHDVWKKAPAG